MFSPADLLIVGLGLTMIVSLFTFTYFNDWRRKVGIPLLVGGAGWAAALAWPEYLMDGWALLTLVLLMEGIAGLGQFENSSANLLFFLRTGSAVSQKHRK